MKTCKKGWHQYEGKRCPECRKVYDSAWNASYYKDHTETIKKYSAAWRLENRERVRATRDAYNTSALARVSKDRPCTDCGKRFNYYVMDLDHVPERGSKLFSISRPGKRSVAEIKDEIAKCDPVCANCHRERTHQRQSKKETDK